MNIIDCSTRPPKRLFWLLGLILSSLTSASFAAPPGTGWSDCARENQRCVFNGQREVAYGQNSSYRYQVRSNGVACNNRVFGDPIRGSSKACWTRTLSTNNYISIDASNPKQRITLMGGDMERSAGFLNKASNSQQIADWYYKDINFSYSRVSFDRKQELVEGNPNMSFYNGTVAAMKLVQNARPSVKFWATLKSDYDGYGTTNNLPDWIYTGNGYNGGSYQPSQLNINKYARFLADYLKHMSDNGVAINMLSISKEWQRVFNADNERRVIAALGNLLRTNAYAGTPMPEFAGPSTWGVRGTTRFVNDMIGLGSLYRYSAISTHSYDNASEAQWGNLIRLANGRGRPVWHTESSSGSGGRTSGQEPPISSPIDVFMDHSMWYRQGLQGELFFENWSRGINSETRAVYFTNGTPGVRLRSYYIMKQFANNAAGGNYIPATKAGLRGAEVMTFRVNNKLIVWVINSTNNVIRNVTVNLNGATISNSPINRLAWYSGSNASGDKTTQTRNNGSRFSTEIDANTIVSYVFDVN